MPPQGHTRSHKVKTHCNTCNHIQSWSRSQLPQGWGQLPRGWGQLAMASAVATQQMYCRGTAVHLYGFLSNKFVNVWACTRYVKYHEGIMIFNIARTHPYIKNYVKNLLLRCFGGSHKCPNCGTCSFWVQAMWFTKKILDHFKWVLLLDGLSFWQNFLTNCI